MRRVMASLWYVADLVFGVLVLPPRRWRRDFAESKQRYHDALRPRRRGPPKP